MKCYQSSIVSETNFTMPQMVHQVWIILVIVAPWSKNHYAKGYVFVIVLTTLPNK